MPKQVFVLNRNGLAQLMKSKEVEEVLNNAAEKIKEAASSMASANIKGAAESYKVELAHPLRFVSIASVRAGTFPGRLDNSKHNTLEKAAGSVKV